MDYFRDSMGSVEEGLRDGGIGERNVHEVVLVGGFTRIPKVQLMIQELFNGKEPKRSINPDEAVAHGAMHDFKRRNRGEDLAGNDSAIRRLRTQRERAKWTLSSFKQATTEIDSLFEVRSNPEFFGNRIVDFCMQDFKRKNRGKDLAGDNHAIRRLHTQCGSAKRTLYASTQATIETDSLFDGIDYSCSLSRVRFEELIMDYFRSSMGSGKKCLRDSVIEKWDVHEVVLVGCFTRIPKVQLMIQEFFNGREPNRSIDPDEAAAVAYCYDKKGSGGRDILKTSKSTATKGKGLLTLASVLSQSSMYCEVDTREGSVAETRRNLSNTLALDMIEIRTQPNVDAKVSSSEGSLFHESVG